MKRILIALGLPALLLFGSAAAGWWNVAEAPVRTEPKPLGDIGAEARESAIARSTESPRALLTGILAARDRGDRAWLARSLASCVAAESLTEVELGVAWTRFEWASAAALWDRIATAEAAAPARIRIEGDRATATWDGHDALALGFVRVTGHWCIADH